MERRHRKGMERELKIAVLEWNAVNSTMEISTVGVRVGYEEASAGQLILDQPEPPY
jgi:hypothetical protein